MILGSGKYVCRIPDVTHRLRANCAKEWGCFLAGDAPSKLTRYDAEKQGLTLGSVLELALVYYADRVLTIGNFYIEENFTEIWGFPVAPSELSTFLIRSISRDKFGLIIERVKSELFQNWANLEDKSTSWDTWSQTAMKEFMQTHIFRFEFTQTSSKNGDYFYLSPSYRKAESEVEIATCQIASQVDRSVCNDKLYNSFEVSSRQQLKSADTELAAIAPAIDVESTETGKKKK